MARPVSGPSQCKIMGGQEAATAASLASRHQNLARESQRRRAEKEALERRLGSTMGIHVLQNGDEDRPLSPRPIVSFPNDKNCRLWESSLRDDHVHNVAPFK